MSMILVLAKNKPLFGWLLGVAIVLMVGGFFMYGDTAEAASFSLNPPAGTYVVGDTVLLDVLVDTEGKTVNAFSGTIDFPSAALKARAISKGNSIVDLWLVEPSITEDDSIVFEGLVLHPGFEGVGKVITIQFEVLQQGTAIVDFSSGLVLANDGYGTNVVKDFESATLSIVTGDYKPVSKRTLPSVEDEQMNEVDPNRLAPVVLSYTHEASTLGEVAIRGVTYPNAEVYVYIKPEGRDVIEKITTSDSGGNFAYTFGEAAGISRLAPANVFAILSTVVRPAQEYDLWLSAIYQGVETETTQPLHVVVGKADPLFVVGLLSGLLLLGLLFFGVTRTRQIKIDTSSQISTVRKDLADVAYDIEKYQARKRQNAQLGDKKEID